MQDTGTNELMVGDSLDALRERIPEIDQGPTFGDGEIVQIKGYYYRVVGLETDRLTFEPHGPRRDMSKPAKKGGRRRRGQRT